MHKLSSMSMFRILLGYAKDSHRPQRGVGEVLQNELQNFVFELREYMKDPEFKNELYNELVEGIWVSDAWSLKASLSIVISRLGDDNKDVTSELCSLIDDAFNELKEKGLVGEGSDNEKVTPSKKTRKRKTKKKQSSKEKKLEEEVLAEANAELEEISEEANEEGS